MIQEKTFPIKHFGIKEFLMSDEGRILLNSSYRHKCLMKMVDDSQSQSSDNLTSSLNLTSSDNPTSSPSSGVSGSSAASAPDAAASKASAPPSIKATGTTTSNINITILHGNVLDLTGADCLINPIVNNSNLKDSSLGQGIFSKGKLVSQFLYIKIKSVCVY